MRNYLIVFIIVGFHSLAFPQALSIEQLADSLQANNIDITHGLYEIDRTAVQKYGQSYLGTSSFNVQYGQINTKLQDLYYEADQEINNPFMVTASRRANSLEVALLDNKLVMLVRAKKRELKTLYLLGLYYEARRKVFEEEKELFEELERVSKEKLERREISAADHVILSVQLSDMHMNLSETEHRFHETDEALRGMCGINNEQKINYSLELEKFAEVNESLLAPLNPIFYEEFESAAALYAQQERTARLSYFPDLSAGYFNQTIEHDRGFQGIKVGLNFNLFNGINRQQLNEAKLGSRLNTEVKENRLLQMQNNLENTRHHYETYFQLYADLTYDAEEKESVLNNYSEKSFQLGEINPIEYVQVRKKQLDFKLLKIELEYKLALLNNELNYLTK